MEMSRTSRNTLVIGGALILVALFLVCDPVAERIGRGDKAVVEPPPVAAEPPAEPARATRRPFSVCYSAAFFVRFGVAVFSRSRSLRVSVLSLRFSLSTWVAVAICRLERKPSTLDSICAVAQHPARHRVDFAGRWPSLRALVAPSSDSSSHSMFNLFIFLYGQEGPCMARAISRRAFLRAGGVLAGQAVAGSSLFTLGCDLSFFGPLQAPDENGIRLPRGFRSRVLARSGDPVAETGFVWPAAPDGGAGLVEDG